MPLPEGLLAVRLRETFPMSRSKALFGVALIFAFGIAVGFALSVRFSMQRIRSVASGTPEELAVLTTFRLHQGVRFSPEQHKEVLDILTRAELKIAEAQGRIAPEVEVITRQAHQEIRALLSREQLKRLPPLTPQEPRTSHSL